MEKNLKKFKFNLLNKNMPDVFYTVSIGKGQGLGFFKAMKYVTIVSFIVLFILFLLKITILSFFVLILYFLYFIYKAYTSARVVIFGSRKPIEKQLYSLVIKNNFYKVDSEGNFLNSLELAYIENDEMIRVFAALTGGPYQDIAKNLSDRLTSIFGLPLFSQKQDLKYVEYDFRKKPIERIQLQSLPLSANDMTIKIYEGVELDLKRNFSFLISGVSGSGKSYLTYYLLGSFFSKIKNSSGQHALVYCIDPKMSDLYKLYSTTMPENFYGTSVQDAFRIVKEFTNELEERKKIYANSSDFDKTLVEMGYIPKILLIDEYPSLVASMDNKQKADFEKLIGNIARLSRQLGLGIGLIMQQASSESLSTGIREQLVNRFFMGSPSMESARMMFSMSASDLPVVSEKGSGIASIDGREPVAFLAPRFTVNMNEVVLPVMKEVATLEMLTYTKEHAEEIGETPEEVAFLKENGKTYDNWETPKLSID